MMLNLHLHTCQNRSTHSTWCLLRNCCRGWVLVNKQRWVSTNQPIHRSSRRQTSQLALGQESREVIESTEVKRQCGHTSGTWHTATPLQLFYLCTHFRVRKGNKRDGTSASARHPSVESPQPRIWSSGSESEGQRSTWHVLGITAGKSQYAWSKPNWWYHPRSQTGYAPHTDNCNL
jgi:hypothetical protein